VISLIPSLNSALILTELFAGLALIANVLAYQQQSIKAYRMYSGVAMLLLAIHFFRLEAHAACVGCSLAVVRNLVSLKFNDWLTTGFFVGLNLLSLSIEWFYLQHGAEIFIAYTASIIFTIGTLRLERIVDIRLWFTLAESLNLLYAVLVGSVFGSFYCLFNLAILLAFWLKWYQNRKQSKNTGLETLTIDMDQHKKIN
jgi:hypothetical protein